MQEVSKGSLLQAFNDLLKCSTTQQKEISENGHSMAYKFTFHNYYQKLQKGLSI